MRRLSNWCERRFRRFVAALGYRLVRRHKPDYLPPLLYRHLRREDRLYFAQIGANDGQQADPLYEFISLNRGRVEGLVIEPVPDYFRRLQETYRGFPSITPVQTAIHNTETKITIHRADTSRPGIGRAAEGIASIDPEHHRRSGVPSDAMVSEEVPCTRLETLLERYPMPRLDLLQIDTEGYDAEIILGLDFRRVRPMILRFEHGLGHGIMSPELFDRVAKRLQAEGYFIALEDFDAVAYLPYAAAAELQPSPQAIPAGK